MAAFTSKASFTLPAEYASSFTQEEHLQYKQFFAQVDVNKDGDIDMNELRNLLKHLGEQPGEDKLRAAMGEADLDGDGKISFQEFVALMYRMKKDPNSANLLNRKMHKAAAAGPTGGMGYHSYSEEEKVAFAEHINNCLAVDPVIGPRLPIDVQTEDLFAQCADGILLCKLINMAEFDCIDVRALNLPKEGQKMHILRKVENMNLALNAAKAIGCVVTNVNAKDIIDGNSILILGLIWQIIRIQLLASISLSHCPELVCLLEEGEELDHLLKMQPEAILLRWFNHHLARGNHPKRVNNFGRDLADGTALAALLTQLDPVNCDECTETDTAQRVDHVIRNARAMGVETFIHTGDIMSANKKLLLAFVAQLFNTNPNLQVEEAVMQQFTADFANLDVDDAGDTREEKVFRMWINSLGLDNGDLYINNLFSDVQDGVAILKVMDQIQPGVVTWKRVNIPPKNRYKKVENGNYVIETAKVMGLTVVNVGGLDIVDGNRKMILAIMWQLMRTNTLKLLEGLAQGGKKIEDPQIVAWANKRVPSMKIRSFQDSSLSTGVFLLQLCHSINRGVVNWELVVMEASSNEDKLNNAKYAISVARKLGALVFVAPEDIVEVKSRMIMLYCASLWHTENERTVSGVADEEEKNPGSRRPSAAVSQPPSQANSQANTPVGSRRGSAQTF